MTPETLARALEPFFTTKEPGKGTGLGLSQVYGFVRQSGGFLCVDSKVGEGTVIRAFLPSLREAPLGVGPGSTATEGSLPVGSEALLLVEDDEDVRAVLLSSLSSLGYRPVVARNAPEALEILERNRSGFDLVISDVVMPGGMTGVELVREIRQRRPGIAALLVSGYTAGNELVRNNGDIHDMPLLAKPFRQPELATAVRSAIDQVRKNRSGSAPS